MKSDLQKFSTKLLQLQFECRKSEMPPFDSEEQGLRIRRIIRLERELIRMYKEKV